MERIAARLADDLVDDAEARMRGEPRHDPRPELLAILLQRRREHLDAGEGRRSLALHASMIPWRMAQRTSSASERAPSLFEMLARWLSTVLTETSSSAAISLVLRPSATSRST